MNNSKCLTDSGETPRGLKCVAGFHRVRAYCALVTTLAMTGIANLFELSPFWLRPHCPLRAMPWRSDTRCPGGDSIRAARAGWHVVNR